MATPKGLLVVPVGFRSDSTLRALELDATDQLKVRADLGGVRIDVGSYPHDMYSDLGAVPIMKSNNVIGGSASMYTVPAGQKLYVTSLYISVENGAAVAGVGQILVNNAVPATVWQFVNRVSPAQTNGMTLGFSNPLLLDSGWALVASSPTALINVWCGMTGYLI